MVDTTAPRAHLVRALEADLIGPFRRGLAGPDGTSEDWMASQEELELPPSRWYLTGFLAPQLGRLEEEDDRARNDGAAAYADAVLALFIELYWPFEGPRPELYYDPSTLSEQTFTSLHAKCIVVDHEQTLITSANFTERGQSRNIEVGVLVRDALFAQALEQQWFNLVSSDAVVRWGG